MASRRRRAGYCGTVDRVLLVAPPSPAVLAEHDEVREFVRVQLDAWALRAASAQTRLVCSDNDPYCPEGATATYAGLDPDCDVLPGAGHVDPDAGYGAWPFVAAWCRDHAPGWLCAEVDPRNGLAYGHSSLVPLSLPLTATAKGSKSAT